MKKLLLAGLIILLPVAITYWLIKFVINLITNPFEAFVQMLLIKLGFFTEATIYSHEQLIMIFSKMFIILALFLLIMLVGAIGRWFFFRSLFHLADHILHAIPIINKVYLACKDFTSAIFSPKSGSFSQVVLVPFPSKEHLSIGLITSEFKAEALKGGDDELVSVLIPGTPNPTIGFLLMFSKKQLTFTDMKVDQAIKYVMSCGSVLPQNLTSRLVLRSTT